MKRVYQISQTSFGESDECTTFYFDDLAKFCCMLGLPSGGITDLAKSQSRSWTFVFGNINFYELFSCHL